jgi:ribonuclease P protein subunit RPR2
VSGEIDEREDLRAMLDESGRTAAAREQQLERYADDLRESFRREQGSRQELERSYVATVRALCNAVEARDAYTGRHAERVAAYGMAIARAAEAPFAGDSEVEFGFLLHDIGKVAMPDSILWKPEPLTSDERTLMERHPVVGWEILREVSFLDQAKLVVRHHHERWDGTGYPDHLAGETIPLTARVFSVADTLDALTTLRPYRRPSSIADAKAIIAEASGTQFDPDVVAVFMAIPEDELAEIQARGS